MIINLNATKIVDLLVSNNWDNLDLETETVTETRKVGRFAQNFLFTGF